MKKKFLGEFIEEVSERNKSLEKLPVLSVTNSKGFVLSEDQFTKQVYSKDLSTYKIVYKENIAYNPSRINVGSIALLEDYQKGLVSPLYEIFKVKDGMVPKYLLYYLQSKEGLFFIKNMATGSVRDTVKLAAIKSLKCYVPSVEKQKKIVETLDQIKNIIEKRNYQIKVLDELIKSVFLEMFQHFVEKVKIGDIADIQTGSTPSRKNEMFWRDGNIPWIKTAEVKMNYIESSEEFITEEALEKTSVSILPVDTILIAMYGQGVTRGRVALLKTKATTNQACAAILPNDKFLSEFLFRQLMINYTKLRDLGRGGNQLNLNLSLVKNFEIILPPITKQEEFINISRTIELEKRKIEKSLCNLNDLYESTLQKAFKGELFQD